MDSSGGNKRTILILDDSPIVLKVSKAVLERAGYAVATLDNPFFLAQTLKSSRPQLVLLDVNMPALQGDKLLSISKVRDLLAGAAVVFHSDKNEADLEELVRRLGTDGYIKKTGDQADFLRQIEHWLGVAQRRAGGKAWSELE